MHIISQRIGSQLYLRIVSCHILQNSKYVTAIASLGKLKKVKGKGGAIAEKIKLPVETDTTKLATYLCGSNLLAEGGENIELKPDSEYPEWLWNLHIGKNKSLDELDPETFDYWNKVRALAIRHNHKLRKLRKF